MKFSLQNKNGSVFSNKVCWIAALLLGVAFLFSVYLPSNTIDQDGSPDSAATSGGSDYSTAGSEHQCGHGCSHSKAKRRKTVAKPVSVQGVSGVSKAAIGTVKQLEFSNGLVVSGKVSMNEIVPDGRRAVSLSLANGGYVYYLEDAESGYLGSIVVAEKPDEKVAYKFEGKQGEWTITELDFQQYVCSAGSRDDQRGMPIDNAPFTPPGQAAIIPLLNSRPSAEACVYLDFDGEVVTGTRWNANIGGQTINALEPGLSETEIRAIWEEASEDVRPFELNVTTDRAVFDNTPVNRRMHVIITPTTDAAPGAGGVAYLDSFYDGSIDPCWVFNLGPTSAGMTVSHEVGHTFGLRHDGLGGQEYHPGNGGWGPIMGAPFGEETVSWSEGNYANNTNTEDDLAMIADTSTNGFGYRADEHGDSNASGFDLSGNTGEEAVEVVGVIETTDDVDGFSFTTTGGVASVTATPTSAFPNLNIRARLFDDAGNLVSEDDPGGTFSASVSSTLDAGVYHLHVEGVANGSPDVTGFNDYPSLGAYGITGNISGLGGLIIDIVDPVPEDVSILDGNGLVLRATVVGSADSQLWSVQSGPVGGVATFYPDNGLATRATFSRPGLYTLLFRAEADGVPSEATMRVSVEATGDVQLFANRGPAITVSSPEEFYSREGLLNGRAQDDGVPVDAPPALEWVVVSGNAVIENPTAVSPLITFADSQSNVVALESSDGQIRTFKQVTVQSVYEAREVIKAGTMANWFIPTDNSLGLTWVAPAFPDGAWNTGPLGLGFNTNDDYNPFLNQGTNIRSAMRSKSPSAYIRMPFTLPSLDYVQGLKLKIHYNDAFVLYLNGVEVTRKNAPLGALSWNSTALLNRSLQDVLISDEIDLSGLSGSLVLGENVLAIHGLNNSKNNGRFLIHPILQADIVASPYLAFMEANGLDLAPYLDKDGDTLLNFVEHALGTDPNTPDAVNPLTPLGEGLVSVVLPEDMPQDIDYIVEQSPDMATWTQVASKRGQAPWEGSGLTVSVNSIAAGKITYNLRTIEALPMAFFRLRYDLRGPQAPAAP